VPGQSGDIEGYPEQLSVAEMGPDTLPVLLIVMLLDRPMEQTSRYEQRITHYNILRTIEDLCGLPAAGNPDAAPITEKWAVLPIRDG
jgi:hypothetical protein